MSMTVTFFLTCKFNLFNSGYGARSTVVVYKSIIGPFFFFNCHVYVWSPGNAKLCGHKGAGWHLSCGRIPHGSGEQTQEASRASLSQEYFSSLWRRELVCISQRCLGEWMVAPRKVLSPSGRRRMKGELGFQQLVPVAQVTMFF